MQLHGNYSVTNQNTTFTGVCFLRPSKQTAKLYFINSFTITHAGIIHTMYV